MAISAALGSAALLPAGLGFRNVVVNGGFTIWQRGVTTYDGTAYRYTADRWQAVRGGYTAGQSLTRQSASLDGFQYCVRVARDSGNTSTQILYLAQTIETANSIQFQNKQVTLSFYARAGANYSAASSALNVRVATGTGTDQNHFNGGFTNETNIVNSNVTLTTSWQRFVVTGYAASTTTQLGLTFLFTPSGTAGAADYFEITGVQLEQNYQPTPFEQRPIGVELHLCQRYFQILPYGKYAEVPVALGYAAAPTYYYYGAVDWTVPMRAAPTVSIPTVQYRTSSSALANVTSIPYWISSGNGAYFALSVNSVGWAALCFFLGVSSFSAEL